MNGAQVAGWLRHLADQVQADDKLANRTLRAGPIQVVVPNPSTVRSWKSRHGSLEPPSVAQASHDLVREVIKDALTTRDAALLQRIRDAVAAEVSKVAERTISSLDLKNTASSEPDRSTQAGASDAAAAPRDYDHETLFPLTFALHETAVAECAERYGVSREVILKAVDEFKVYWTVGAGAGKRRSQWQARCRQDLKRKWETGRLDSIAKELGSGPGPARAASKWEDPDAIDPSNIVPPPAGLMHSLKSFGRAD